MSICLYKKHPPHNLGGENYPHFISKYVKDAWVVINLIGNPPKWITLNITRVSFDTARLVLNVKKFLNTKYPNEIAGLVSQNEQKNKEEYWFVVGWSFGSNQNVVILELQLDYWLTYWPLKFNQALVRVNRKHMNRFLPWATKKNPRLNIFNDNRQLQIPEKTYPPNILNAWEANLSFNSQKPLELMIGIVFTPVGGGNLFDKNYFTQLGNNKPKRQNGFLIFSKINQIDINSWLSMPGITQSFYFFMDSSDIKTVKYEVTCSASSGFVGSYDLKKADTFGYDFLWATSADIEDEFPTTTIIYRKLAIMIVKLTYLSMEADTYFPSEWRNFLPCLTIDSNGKVRWNFNSKYWKTAQLVSLKSFFRNGIASSDGAKISNQYVRGYEKVYFTTINIFNQYMQKQLKKQNYYLQLNLYELKKKFEKSKFTIDELVDWERKLKLRMNFLFLLGLQKENQKIKPYLWEGTTNVRYYFYWFLTIQNSYFVAEPGLIEWKPQNKKYNFVATNETTMPNYTDGSIEFYQKQGISYQTGIDQARFALNWAKRYNQFQEREIPFEIFKGAVGNLAGNYFSGGLIGGSAGRYAGLAYGAVTTIGGGIFKEQEMKLQNEMREKKAFYGLKQLQSKQADAFNQPVTTNSNDQVELMYQLLETKLLPFLIVMRPTPGDYIAQAKLDHKYGNLNDQDEIVDLNNEWTRRCWNYWEIHNIEQAIIKDDLNHNVITFFNNLFNHGVRLWNVFFTEVKFNDYSLENWEQKMLEDEK